MADETRASGEPDGSPRRRRVPPPTIDLQATSSDTSGGGAADPPDPAPPVPPAGEPADPAPSHAAASPPPGDRPEAAAPPSAARPARARMGAPLAAGALGAALVLGMAAGLWALYGAPPDGASDVDTRLARAEAQLGVLARRDAKTTDTHSDTRSDTGSTDDLARRLARLEAALAAPRAPQSEPALADLTRRTDDAFAASREARERAETAANALGDVARQLAALNAERARTPAVERTDLDALGARLAALESATKTLGDQLAKVVAAAGAGDVRHAVIAMALDAAAQRGAPYGRELAALDPQVAGAAAIAALKPFAQSGIPTTSALSHELAALTPEALAAADTSEQPEGGGFLDRLQANAERLVRIRPIAQQRGAEPSAVLRGVETKALQGDVAGALAEAGRLPPAVRAPLEPWIQRAQARNAALAASSGLAARAFEQIARTPQQGTPPK
ncbi:MAG TPA: hypothetical protein VH249_14565 [Xanthobacteraceae bacterium]|jgi:hypothetical protein|nr:hypothetical protein [Xanthobacteraceae bacterium]